MGWNSWNKYGCNGLNETVVKKMADAFVSSGLKDAGYKYINLDDCWMDGRDANGKLKWNASRFPSGIPECGARRKRASCSCRGAISIQSRHIPSIPRAWHG